MSEYWRVAVKPNQDISYYENLAIGSGFKFEKTIEGGGELSHIVIEGLGETEAGQAVLIARDTNCPCDD